MNFTINKSKSRILWCLLFMACLITLALINKDLIKNEVLIYQSDSHERVVVDNYKFSNPILYNKQFTHFPITIEEITLPESFSTGSSDVGFMNNKVVIMDRIGTFFILEEGVIRRLGKVPNEIERFEQNYGETSTNSMRAHSFVVNCEEDLLIVYYSAYDKRSSGKLTLDIFPLDCDGPGEINWEKGETLFEVRLTIKQLLQSQAAGGALLLDGDNIFVSVGYAETDADIQKRVSQDVDLPFGKIWKVEQKRSAKIHSIGHRNVTGLSKVENQLIAIEHGPKGGDEINAIRHNDNYGWPDFSFGQRYNTFEFVSETQNRKHRLPVYTFIPSIAPSDMVTTNIFSEYGPVLAISTLKAQSIYLALFQENRVINEQSVYLGSRIRSLNSSDQAIFAITDDRKMIKIFINTTYDNAGDGLYFKNEVLKQCLTCHVINKDLTQQYKQINLYGVLARGFGKQENISYSDVLSQDNTKTIDLPTMKKFLRKSGEYNLTLMPKVSLSDDEIEQLYDILTRY